MHLQKVSTRRKKLVTGLPAHLRAASTAGQASQKQTREAQAFCAGQFYRACAEGQASLCVIHPTMPCSGVLHLQVPVP